MAPLSLCPHVVQREEGALWSLFYNGANLIHEGFTVMNYLLPKDLSPNTITLESRSSTYEFGENTDIQTTEQTIASFVLLIQFIQATTYSKSIHQTQGGLFITLTRAVCYI